MEATASLNTKIDPLEKQRFVENAAALGMTPSAAIKVFVHMFNAYKGFPFPVCAQPQINYSSSQLLEAELMEDRLVVPAAWRDDDDE